MVTVSPAVGTASSDVRQVSGGQDVLTHDGRRGRGRNRRSGDVAWCRIRDVLCSRIARCANRVVRATVTWAIGVASSGGGGLNAAAVVWLWKPSGHVRIQVTHELDGGGVTLRLVDGRVGGRQVVASEANVTVSL